MASCIPLPHVPVPDFPAGLDLSVQTPSITFDPELCCKLLPYPVAVPSVPLGGIIDTAFLLAIAAQVQIINAWIDSLAISCPRE